jgi:hypothetical protein
LARTFETELSALGPDAADETLELLDLHTSWETWDRLRHGDGEVKSQHAI